MRAIKKTNPSSLPVLLMMGLIAFPESSASSSSSNPSQHPDISAFTYQSIFDAENDSEPSIPNTDAQSADPSPLPHPDESSVVSSSLLYDGGCVVSAEAIMCAGGEGFFDFYPRDFDESEDEESDDDDDDDNDGHSSMLSNASLRRSKVGASGYHQRSPPQSQASQQDEESAMVASVPPSVTRSHALRQRRSLFGVN